MNMFEEVKKYEESYNQIHWKYPSSFRNFSDKKLKEFDETQTGTIKELTERKEKYSEQLKAEYKELQKKEREELNLIEAELCEKVYQQSYAKDFPNGRKIFDHLFSIAYDRGHSCGMQEVISEFDEIDGNFHELMKIMDETCVYKLYQ
jgi:molybdopterin converting factor small subunit